MTWVAVRSCDLLGRRGRGPLGLGAQVNGRVSYKLSSVYVHAIDCRRKKAGAIDVPDIVGCGRLGYQGWIVGKSGSAPTACAEVF